MFINRVMADTSKQSNKEKRNSPEFKNSGGKASRSTAGRWTNVEHNRFTDALKIYGKNWKKVEDYVATRTGAQVRSHAQKFFLKVQKKLNVDKTKIIENLDNAVINEKLMTDTKYEDDSDDTSLNKRNYNDLERNNCADSEIELDVKEGIDNKELLLFAKKVSPVKDYLGPEHFDIDEKMQSYMPSFHKDSYEYDSKFYGISRNSRASRNNEFFDLEDKAYQSYFKDKESMDIDDKFRFSKNNESVDMDEKLHGLFKHKESFEVDNKNFNKSRQAGEYPMGSNLNKNGLDEGILNLKMVATDLNNNILKLEQQYKSFMGDQPVQ